MSGAVIIRNEPFGHLVAETKLERYWAQAAGVAGLRRRRVLKFDPHACATYAPMSYVSTEAKLRTDLPDEDWIRESLKNFIRVEFSARRSMLSPPNFAIVDVKDVEVSDALLSSLARKVDEEVKEIVGDLQNETEAKTSEGMAKQVYRLICDPRVGAKTNQVHVSETDFVARIARSIESEERLLLVLLGFPFKDQNRFRVQGAANQPDVGEIAFLLRLYRVTQAIYQIHPYGADILVLTDGETYHDIFGVDKNSTLDYGEKIKSYRSQLNLQGTVSFVSLSDLVARASQASQGSGGMEGAGLVKQHIRDKIAGLFATDESLREYADVLISAIKWNHESKVLLDGVGPEDAWSILTADRERIAEQLWPFWDNLHEKARLAAIEYGAVNLMLRWLDLVHLFFPEALRCTIHAKPGQICLARGSSTFPWNGVAWSENWPMSIDDFEVRPFHSLAELGPVRKVVVRALGYPYFFTRATYGSNILAAQSVLPLDAWHLDEITGKPFKSSDAAALARLGVGDTNFSWERLPKDDEYYRKIIKFRLDHYAQYGFGVQGLWIDDLLIGQCGLQVLNETRDQVELVIFLGKAHAHRGIGMKLSRHILASCVRAGVKAVYGVARTENMAALKLLQRLSARPLRTQVHFGSIATVYDIPLERT